MTSDNFVKQLGSPLPKKVPPVAIARHASLILPSPAMGKKAAGQVADICQAEDLISASSFEHLLADKGCD
jgi:hypothetical protein